MPLNIEMVRNGRRVKGGPSGEGWGVTDLNAAYTVAYGEACPDHAWTKDLTIGQVLEQGSIAEFEMMGLPYLMSGFPLQDEGEQVVERDHELHGTTGSGPYRFKKGDKIRAWRG